MQRLLLELMGVAHHSVQSHQLAEEGEEVSPIMEQEVCLEEVVVLAVSEARGLPNQEEQDIFV